MPDVEPFSFRFFDPADEIAVTDRRLPHWAQSHTVCFLTWRAWDSIPKSVLTAWVAERAAWLARHGVDPTAENWRDRVRRLPAGERLDYRRRFSDRWHDLLDECRGACVLRCPDLRRIVADSLMHFDGDRYHMTDFVVMPNHVHVLAAFPDEQSLLAQCDNWKHYTATRINKQLGRTGRFWQVDGFDHLIRSADQFEAVRAYIADNPRRAGLAAGEYTHFTRGIGGDGPRRGGQRGEGPQA